MRVLHISPTYFDRASTIGGAERYVWELARAQARVVDVTLLTFGRTAEAGERDGVHVERLRQWPLLDHPLAANPLRWRLLAAIRRADVVHCHQANTFVTNAGVLAGRLLGRPVFVTDFGGGHRWTPSAYVPLMRLATGFLLLSNYSRQLWVNAPRASRPDRLEVMYGGVDTTAFCPGGRKDPHLVVFVGRLVPHKGIEYLIDAIAPPLTLRIVGQPYDQAYTAMLRDRARDKPVVFEHDVDDAGVVARLQSALAAVLPSVSAVWHGGTTQVAELFGLAAVEAMACGTPAIVSRTGSLPELVDDGTTGCIVPPADVPALRERLLELHARPDAAAEMGRRARAAVLERFTWDATAARSLDAYRRTHAA